MKNFRYRHLLRKLPEKCKRIPFDYERRNEHIKRLDFESYAHYLNSDLWKIIRHNVLERDNNQCVVCGKRATQVHHNSYEVDVLVGKDISQIVSLCRFHHKMIEFDNGEKTNLEGARNALEKHGIEVPELKRQHFPNLPSQETKPFIPIKKDVPGELVEQVKVTKNLNKKSAMRLRERLREEGKISGDFIESVLERKNRLIQERKLRRKKFR